MPTGENAALQVRNLDFFYGDFKASPTSIWISPTRGDGLHRPSGCGKSTLLRTFNRMYDLYPGQRAEGQIMFHGRTCSTRART